MTQSGHRRLVEKTLISVLVVLAGASKIRVLIIHLRRGDGGVERIPTTVAKITLADVESWVNVRHQVCQKNARSILQRCLYQLPF